MIRRLAVVLVAVAVLFGVTPSTPAAADVETCPVPEGPYRASVESVVEWMTSNGYTRQQGLGWGPMCSPGILTAAQIEELAALRAAEQAALVTRADAARAEHDKAVSLIPRLTVTGGTKAEQAKVRRLIARYRIPVPPRTLLRLVVRVPGPANRIGLFSATGHFTVGVGGRPYRVPAAGTILVERARLKDTAKAVAVIAHELAHAAQRATKAGAASGREQQADCMAQIIGGRAVARYAYYLNRANRRCTASELREARRIWAAVP